MTYKSDVNDVRESPTIAVLERLADSGAKVSYHDPYVRELQIAGKALRSQPVKPNVLSAQDSVVLLTAHSVVDFAAVVEQPPLVFDSRGITRGRPPNVVRL